MSKISLFFATLFACVFLSAAHANTQRENPRSVSANAAPRTEQPVRSATQSRSAVSRAAAPQPARGATSPERSATVSRSAAPARTATASAPREQIRDVFGRGGQRSKNPNDLKPRGIVARSAVAGGTTSFGSAEYIQCKESYAACMNQFCSDDKYGKCGCSNKIIDLKARLESADSAASALENFAMTDLVMIDQDAAAVTAMYSATEGELAIPQDGDDSAMAKKISAIGGMIGNTGSGKLTGKSTNRFQLSSNTSGGFNIDFDSISDDLLSYGRGGIDAVDINLTGDALYNSIHAQCASMLKDVCSAKNLSLAVSLYKQDINKDCDKVDKTVKGREDSIKKGVTEASMALMEARLDDFESRNSLTDLQCLDEAMNVMTQDGVCGKDWVRCLDFSGQFMKPNGEPIYKGNFKKLEESLKFNENDPGMTLRENQLNNQFVAKLSEKRVYLETKNVFGKCRDSAERVWLQVLDRSLLEIKSAQREKVEKVRDECISKLSTCMDVQMGAFDGISDIIKGDAPTTGSYGGATGGGGESQAGGKSAESIKLAQTICVDIQETCNSVFGKIFEGYLNNALDSARIKSMCTVNLNGKWNPVQGSCEIEF